MVRLANISTNGDYRYMKLLRSALLLSVSAGSLMAQAATTRPTTVQAGMVLVAGTDLVVDSIGLEALPFLGRVSGEPNEVHVQWLTVTARVTNRGRERWASRGEVGFNIFAGKEADGPTGRREPAQGVKVVPAAPGVARQILAPFGPFRAQASIPGSLASGQSRIITARVNNSNRESSTIFERDKYYTVISTIRATGDVDDSNNRSVRVGRVDTNHRGRLVRWDPIAYRPTSDGTVRVNAPPRP
jgi:hypothetical protein